MLQNECHVGVFLPRAVPEASAAEAEAEKRLLQQQALQRGKGLYQARRKRGVARGGRSLFFFLGGGPPKWWFSFWFPLARKATQT